MKKPITFQIDENGCWNCISHAKNPQGYPQMKNKGMRRNMHRRLWMMNNPLLKRETVVMHICNNPSCINPWHLREGTQSENIQQMYDEGRGNKGRKSNLSKYPDELIEEVLRESKAGKSDKELEKLFGMNRVYIYQLRKGIWRKDIHKKVFGSQKSNAQ